MAPSIFETDPAVAIFSGLSYIIRPKIFAIFVTMALSLFLVIYLGLYVFLNLTLNSGATYTTVYPSYVIPTALGLVLLEVFVFFYLLSLGLEVKKRVELKAPVNFKDALLTALIKFPKFFIATISQLFLLFGGFVLLIIPGFYFGVKSIFFNIESHNGNVSLSEALKDSFNITKARFLKILPVFLFYLVLFTFFVSLLFNTGLNLLYFYLGMSIVVSFFMLGYLFSADKMYKILMKYNNNKISSSLFRRAMSQNT